MYPDKKCLKGLYGPYNCPTSVQESFFWGGRGSASAYLRDFRNNQTFENSMKHNGK